MKFADKRRIRALILRHLNTLENSGDCFTHAEELQKQIANYPLYYELGEDYSVPRNLFHPLNEDYANHFREGDKLVLVEANDTMYYYLSKVYNAEKGIEKNISELLRKPDNDDTYSDKDYIQVSAEKLKSIIGNHFQKDVFKEERQELIQNFLKKRFYVVAGSAGSGKSYEALKLIEYLYQEKNQKYIILAPTGKAALRLSSDKDFPNIKASTIDKFINDVKNHKISQAQIRQYQNVVIDETSMVDLLKFNKLLKIFNFKEPSFKRLILIGDPNQLPAIGYGRVLEDIISYLRSDKNYKDNFIQLETNCRSELAENAVTRLAESFKVNAKDDIDPDIRRKLENRDVNISEGFRIQYWENKDSLYTLIGEEFKGLTEELSGNTNSKLNQLLGLSEDGDILNNELDIENFQILSPYHSQYSGATGINDYIQSVFKKDLKYQLHKDIFKESDKLIRTQNYYVKEKLVVSNGTLGFIKGSDEKFIYESDNGITELPIKEIRSSEKESFELAYAITIHKSQGSGFNHLFLIIPERYGLLSKELIYTALTRTKKSITVFLQISDKQTKNPLDKALERSYSASRKTSLLLDKPYRFYDLEPEKGVFVESRVELLIYHVLMKKRDELGSDKFNFSYEEKPIINGETVNIKTDFTIYANDKIWYWEHLGLLGQRKYTWTWNNIKTKTYREAGIWEQVITTDERNGIAPHKIESLVDIIINDKVSTEDKFNTYSKHHYYLR